MKKIVFLLLISFGINAQTKIKYSQMENPATSSVNLGTQTFSVATITGSTTMGTGTVVANSGALGIVRIKQGSSWLDFGQSSAGFGALWIRQTPSTTNYLAISDGTNYWLNSANSLNFGIGSSDKMTLTSTTFSCFVPFYSTSTGIYEQALWAKSTFTSDGVIRANAGITCIGAANVTRLVMSSTTFTNQAGTSTITAPASSGTLALTTDDLYSINLMGQNGSPADNLTYVFGNLPMVWVQSTYNGAVYLPQNSTLIGWTANFYCNGTGGSAESATLQLDIGTSTVTLNSSITLSTTATPITYTASGLSQAVSAGYPVSAKLVCPAWVTNPTGVYFGLTLWYRKQ